MADPRANPHIDWYAQLGVRADASRAEIDAAYRRLVRALHPDLADPGSFDVERLQRVLEAHAVLSSPARRRDYDDFRRRPTRASSSSNPRPCPVCRGARTITTPCGVCRAQGYEHVAGLWLATTRPCSACDGSRRRRSVCGACGGTGATDSRGHSARAEA